jgi:uncharacterized membrane protein YfcA
MSNLLLLSMAAFFAGLVDSMAGGGGLISLPALLAAGLDPHLALGTNKIQSCMGTTFSTGRYLRNGHVQIKMASAAAICALIGSYLGSRAALAIPSQHLSAIIPPLILVVALVTFFRKSFGAEDTFGEPTGRDLLLAGAVGLVIGFYDGFFGPGTGTFLAFAFVFLFGFGFVRATGNTKVVNLASNVAAALTFGFSGKVVWAVALPMGLANIAGNWIGSGLAMKGGAKVIKPVFGFVLALLFVKIAFLR